MEFCGHTSKCVRASSLLYFSCDIEIQKCQHLQYEEYTYVWLCVICFDFAELTYEIDDEWKTLREHTVHYY